MNKLNSFYKSDAWIRCRREYKNKVYYCEICSIKGNVVKGDYVLHKRPLKRNEYYNADVSLDFDNLILLCKDCYSKRHKQDNNTQTERNTATK